MTTSQETQSESDKCQKEREKRKPNTMYVLVLDKWGDLRIEPKSYVRRTEFEGFDYFVVLCDDQPRRVLQGMLKLLEEN